MPIPPMAAGAEPVRIAGERVGGTAGMAIPTSFISHVEIIFAGAALGAAEAAGAAAAGAAVDMPANRSPPPNAAGTGAGAGASNRLAPPKAAGGAAGAAVKEPKPLDAGVGLLPKLSPNPLPKPPEAGAGLLSNDVQPPGAAGGGVGLSKLPKRSSAALDLTGAVWLRETRGGPAAGAGAGAGAAPGWPLAS